MLKSVIMFGLGSNKHIELQYPPQTYQELHLHEQVRADLMASMMEFCIAVPVSSGGVVVTPLAGPFLFSFASQCVTAPGDTAYSNNVLFF